MRTVEPVTNGSWWMKEVRGRTEWIHCICRVYSEEREKGRRESHNHGGEGHTKSDTMENEKYMKSNTHTHERETE